MSIISRLSRYTTPNHNPFIQAFYRNRHKKSFNKVTWKKPEKGWTKLNYDGSSKLSGKSSIGGIFRNDQAEFLLGYSESIGKSSSLVAEVAALRRGLEIVVENGWSHVWLEGDSKSLVDIIVDQKKPVKCAEVEKHLSCIKLIMSEIENCIISHVYREGNRAADKFAKMGHKFKGPQLWHVLPNEVLRIVDDDANGKIFPRKK